MIPYKSIFEIPDLTSLDCEYIFRYRGLVSYRRFKYGILFNHLDKDEQWNLMCQWERAPVTEEEYYFVTTQLDRYEDLFYLFLRRGEFDTAFEYEKLSGIDYKSLCNIPQDIFFENEIFYREWRFKETFKKAIRIAKYASYSQDNSVESERCQHHILRVMAAGCTMNEKIVGILHHILDDFNWTLDKLQKEGFAEEIIEALHCLKQFDDETYREYIERIKTNSLATAVKLNDLSDNMDIRHFEELTDQNFKLLQKYYWAYKELYKIVGGKYKYGTHPSRLI